jgi:flagellar hook-length control protein FliK
MTKAAELFQINTSNALGSDLNARRAVKPADGSKSTARFGDMLTKASRPARKSSDEGSAAPRADSPSSDTKRTDDEKAAEKAKPKATKAGKSDSRRRPQRATDDSSEAADTASTDGSPDAAADAAPETPVDEASTPSESAEPATAKENPHEPVAEAAPTDLSALAMMPSPQPVEQQHHVEEVPCGDSDAAAANITAVGKGPAEAVNPNKAATQPEAIDSDQAEADPAAAAEAPSAASATKGPQRPGLRAPRPRDSATDETSPAAVSPQNATARQDPDAIAAGSTSFDQLAEMLGDVATGHSAAATNEDKPSATVAAPITAGYVPPMNGPREATHTGPVASADASPPAPEARFADDNHEKIVSGVRGELLPNGGTMKLRLDPPELGTLQVSLHMRDGVVSAAFQTANGDAARLLSHTLGDLRSTLEAHGIVVDKLHVQQSPREESGSGTSNQDSHSRGQTFEQQQDARRDQQRRDMVQKLWDRLAGLSPIDLVA